MNSYAQKSFVAKNIDKTEWVLIDAQDMPLGRMSTRIAKLLRGKHKATFTPNADTGVNVIVINSDKVKITGSKLQKNKFHWHTGYPGGIKERTWKDIPSDTLVIRAVKRMMPKDSRLADKQMSSLRVYTSNEHPHAAQSPKTINIDLI